MSAETFDVLVLGVGGWGSAALYQLARRGVRVAGIEQFVPGHDRGSSHGESRIIRMAYFMHPDYVPVLRRAYELWRELEEAAAASLMTLPGLLCIGEPGGPFLRGLATCYATHEIPHERWTAAEARARFPQFQIGDELSCYWDPLGGYVNADASVRSHVRLAEQHGARLFTGETVQRIVPTATGVTVYTEQRTFSAAKVVVAAGAFASRFFPRLIEPVRKVLAWYRVADPTAFTPGPFPAWIAKVGGLNFYGFPSLDSATIKCAEDTGGETLADPLTADPRLRVDDEANLRPFSERLFGSALGERTAHKTCLYENSADRHFILDAHPEHDRVILALGGSGHGFKFSSVIGEIAADLAQHGTSAVRPDIFRLGARSVPLAAA